MGTHIKRHTTSVAEPGPVFKISETLPGVLAFVLGGPSPLNLFSCHLWQVSTRLKPGVIFPLDFLNSSPWKSIEKKNSKKRHISDKQTQPWTKLSLGSELISWNDTCDNCTIDKTIYSIDKIERRLSIEEFVQVRRNQVRAHCDADYTVSSTLWHVSRNHGKKSRIMSGDNVQVTVQDFVLIGKIRLSSKFN